VTGIWTFLVSLVEWQNILFTTTIALGVVLFGAQTFGVFGHGDGDHDLGGAAGELDAGDGANLDAEGFVSSGLKGLGFGRIPLSLLLPLWLSSFGFTGLVASWAFGGIGAHAAFPELRIVPVIGAALFGSLVPIRVVARVFKRLIPDTVKTASDRLDLLGLVGVVKSGVVDVEFGQVQVIDGFGHELEVPCIALDAERTAKYGEEVVLVDWEPAINRFKIVPFENERDDREKRIERGQQRAKELRTAAKVSARAQ
jgi:hypothetical protein